ncbi:hypothetical protein ON010_g2928 [Phytophthora cinnamomi]|nr:hypothetical protein ON010_g2928 [Phytophthora cinnamomi]
MYGGALEAAAAPPSGRDGLSAVTGVQVSARSHPALPVLFLLSRPLKIDARPSEPARQPAEEFFGKAGPHYGAHHARLGRQAAMAGLRWDRWLGSLAASHQLNPGRKIECAGWYTEMVRLHSRIALQVERSSLRSREACAGEDFDAFVDSANEFRSRNTCFDGQVAMRMRFWAGTRDHRWSHGIAVAAIALANSGPRPKRRAGSDAPLSPPTAPIQGSVRDKTRNEPRT